MNGGRGWIAAIAGVIVLCIGATMALLVAGSVLMERADSYFARFDFSTPAPVEIDEEEYSRFNDLYVLGTTLAGVAAPLLLCTVCGIVILLAVLAQRRDQVPARQPDQAEATAAS